MGENSEKNSPKKGVYKHGAFLKGIACSTPLEVKKILRSSARGLSEHEAGQRLGESGRNEITSEKNDWRKQLAHTILNRFNVLVLALALVSYLTHDLRAAVVMALMVVLSVTLTFFQEFRSTKAAGKLRAMVDTLVTVTRRKPSDGGEDAAMSVGLKREIPLVHVVPGDFVHLCAGDIIPGDLKLFTSKDLFVNQSSLTGESLPVEKSAGADSVGDDSLLDYRSLCFLGSNVVSGTATGFFVKTGKDSYLGSIATKVLSQRTPTSFDRGVQHFTGLLLKVMLVMVPLAFLINGFTKGDWFEAFLFAVAVAIGLTPEMLPMIVTVSLAKGAMEMARRKVIVKRLGSIQNFGAMDVLCTDKTGTLTEDAVIFSRVLNADGKSDDKVLRLACLNSTHQTGLKNFLDLALVKHALAHGINNDSLLLDELPFDFSRKRMSVLVKSPEGAPVLICKGSVEEVLGTCDRVEAQGRITTLTPEVRRDLLETTHRLNDAGERLIAVAYRPFANDRNQCALTDETDLIFSGFLAFADPPAKETAARALKVLRDAGIQVKILTGDNERVTRRVAEVVGLPFQNLVSGPEVERMSPEELAALVETTSLFVKLTPDHKQRIVEALHVRGHVVGFMGDGINDAPALRSADVGISVNNAVDIAKESADIILLEKDLGVLEAGVIEGRKVFGNIVKYIRMGASSNFGNVFSILGASLLFPFLPMLPVQMLIQNLLYDFSQTTIPFDHVDAEYLERPRKWEIGDIGRFMLFLGPVSSLFDYATFALMWFVFSANTPAQQGIFQAGWFIEGLLSQTLIVHVIRTRQIPFFQSRPSKALVISTALVMLSGIGFPYTRFGRELGFIPPPVQFFPWLVLILGGYCVLAHLTKTWFYKKFGYR